MLVKLKKITNLHRSVVWQDNVQNATTLLHRDVESVLIFQLRLYHTMPHKYCAMIQLRTKSCSFMMLQSVFEDSPQAVEGREK